MIIYHGSNRIIEKPIYGKGNKKNDYGLGFYCTESLELAKEWATSDFDINGFANKYEIDITKYKVLDLTDKKYNILNWMALLLKNRKIDISNAIANQAKEFIINNYYINTDEYDIIIGYRADDSYFSFAKDFINNSISIEQLEKAMKLGNLGIQIVLKSEKVFDDIEFIEYEVADASEYYIKKMSRDNEARSTYLNSSREYNASNGIYIMDIIRGGINHGR